MVILIDQNPLKCRILKFCKGKFEKTYNPKRRKNENKKQIAPVIIGSILID